MCTTVAKYIDSNWFLAKTRDPVPWMRWDDEIKFFDSSADDRYAKWLIQNPDPKEDGYYGGINACGVAFTSTFVHVAENQISYIRRPYVRLILDAATAQEALDIIQSFYPRIGGNMFVADEHACFGIEAVPEQYFVEKITTQAVKTNHFLKLPNRNLDFNSVDGYEKWSKDHYKRASELLDKATSIQNLHELLKDRKNSETKTAICTTKAEDECCTHSAFIFDTKNKKAHYCQNNPLSNNFVGYAFK